ncbi:uncharacterized protein LOC100679775 isoform X7 [Nasonia vitripennis]|uniref:Uncharacterized protein n=1 Tax=Nasonia vitripennis TaxID=7425 RepID=A0A7M7R3B0_NASVI|nr:uncharacterized protein LOC100679775 isoform X7 [Nasonia vitripennis]XP_032457836.1 uncharacterized protein LOC100679775 isoform X7 [Nasonia vitripennis]
MLVSKISSKRVKETPSKLLVTASSSDSDCTKKPSIKTVMSQNSVQHMVKQKLSQLNTKSFTSNFIKMEPHLNIIIIEANIDDEQSNFDKKNLDEYVKFEQEYDEYLLNLHESMLQELQRKKIKQLYDVSYMNKIK